MLSPTRSEPRASGDFEALLSRAEGDARPRPVSLKGLSQRRSSGLRLQAANNSQAGASNPDQQAQLAQQGGTSIQANPSVPEPALSIPADDSPKSSSAGSFATATELLTQRSFASTQWDDPSDDRLSSPCKPNLARDSAQSQHSYQQSDAQEVVPVHEHVSSKPSSPADQQHSPDILAAASDGNEAGLDSQLVSDGNTSQNCSSAAEPHQPVHSLHPSNGVASDRGEPAREQHAADIRSDHASAAPSQPEAAEPISGAQPLATDSGPAIPDSLTQDHLQNRLSLSPSRPEPDGDNPEQAAAASQSEHAQPETGDAKRGANKSKPELMETGKDTVLQTLSAEAPASPVISPAASTSGRSEPAVPALYSHAAEQHADTGSSTGKAGQQQQLRGRQHSRSSSEVVGPGEDDYSVVEHSELESYAGSEGAPSEMDAAAGERTGAQVGSLGRAVGEAAAEVGRNEESEVWRRQRKHMFVLSNAGKPVFSLHGDENALAGLMAVLQALISFAKDQGDALQSVKAGKHVIVFLERGPLYLAAVAATGEPVSILRLQLHLLHAQIVCILTDGFQRMFARNPSYDSRRLLGGADGVLHCLIQSFDSDPAAFLSAFAPLRMPALMRRSLLMALQTAVRASGALYGVLLAGSQIAALTQPRGRHMHAHDLLALSVFVRGSPSFQATETFSPVCLPHFNAAAFLHAYVHYLHSDAGVCLVLLSAQPDSFMRMADAARQLRAEINDSGALQAARRSVSQPGEGHVNIVALPAVAGGGEPGMTPLLHFLYRHPGRSQAVMASWDALAAHGRLPQEVLPLYARVHAAVFPAGASGSGSPSASSSSLRVYYRRTDEYSVLAYASAEYELYAIFDPLAEKATIVRICQRLCSWVKAQQADLFVPV